MTYSEMVSNIATDLELPKAKVDDVLRTFAKTVDNEVRLGGLSVTIPKFGKFKQKIIKPRISFGKQTQGKTTIKFKSFI